MDPTKNLRLKRHYSVIAHSPNVVELRYGVWSPTSFTLTDEEETGRLYKVLTRLDGSLSPSQLAAAEHVPLEEIETLLDHLISLGVMESCSSTSLDHYLDDVIPTLRTVESSPPSELPIVLLGDSELTGEIERYLRSSLKGADISVVGHDAPAWQVLAKNDASWLKNGVAFQEKVALFEQWKDAFLVFATKVINPIQLQMLNRVSLELRIPWIHAAMDGPFLFVGPIFIPYRSACYECFETRVTMNLRESASYQRYKLALAEGQVKHGPLPVEPALSGILAAHTALETLNFAIARGSFTVGKVLAIYLPTMEFTFSDVLRVPGCPACSPSPEADDKELYFDMRALIKEKSGAQ